jgi:hypothetical protein
MWGSRYALPKNDSPKKWRGLQPAASTSVGVFVRSTNVSGIRKLRTDQPGVSVCKKPADRSCKSRLCLSRLEDFSHTLVRAGSPTLPR